MARKKRTTEVTTVPTNEPKPKVFYQDAFQTKVSKKVEDVSKTFEGRGKTITYALAALAVVAVLIGIFYMWNRRSTAAAQLALGKAIELSQSQVTDQPQPAGANEKTFKTEKERAEASIAAFQGVVDKYGGSVGEKAKYFVAVNKLSVDRPAAITELEGLAQSGDEVGKLSKFALAQTKTDDGKFDEALVLYNELAAMDNPIIAKDTINFEIARIYEKQGKKQEAADVYFHIAKTASEAKDLDGKAVPLTQTARDAKAKVQELAPDKAKEIEEPKPENPFSGGNLPLGIQ